MRYDAEHKERTHQRILEEAASAIRTKGPDRIGVAEVMAELGLMHGGFYAHFASKGELIACAITHMFERMMARFERKTQGLGRADAGALAVSTVSELVGALALALARATADDERSRAILGVSPANLKARLSLGAMA